MSGETANPFGMTPRDVLANAQMAQKILTSGPGTLRSRVEFSWSKMVPSGESYLDIEGRFRYREVGERLYGKADPEQWDGKEMDARLREMSVAELESLKREIVAFSRHVVRVMKEKL